MNESQSSSPFQPLAPFQENFIDLFMSDTESRVWHLQAQVGTGKTFTSMELVRRMTRAYREQPLCILVVSPKALTYHWHHSFSERLEGDLYVRLLDRAEWITNFSGGSTLPGLQRCIYIASSDFLKRSEILSTVLAHDWDLVIADEAHRLGGAFCLVERLIESANLKRILLLSSLDVPFKGIDRVHRFEVQRPTASFIEEEVRYSLSEQEERIFSLLEAFADSQPSLQRYVLRKLAESSFYALYESLLRKREKSGTSDEIPELMDEPEQDDLLSETFSSQFEELLSALEAINLDSKSSALIRELHRTAVGKRVNICTKYVQTAAYLETVLREEGFRVILVSGTMPPEWRMLFVAGMDTESILITTDLQYSGVQLPNAEMVVEYDLPDSEAIGFMRRSRYRFDKDSAIRWCRMIRV